MPAETAAVLRLVPRVATAGGAPSAEVATTACAPPLLLLLLLLLPLPLLLLLPLPLPLPLPLSPLLPLLPLLLLLPSLLLLLLPSRPTGADACGFMRRMYSPMVATFLLNTAKAAALASADVNRVWLGLRQATAIPAALTRGASVSPPPPPPPPPPLPPPSSLPSWRLDPAL